MWKNKTTIILGGALGLIGMIGGTALMASAQGVGSNAVMVTPHTSTTAASTTVDMPESATDTVDTESNVDTPESAKDPVDASTENAGTDSDGSISSETSETPSSTDVSDQ